MNNAVNRRLASLQRALATAPTDGLLEDSADPNYAGQIVSGTPPATSGASGALFCGLSEERRGPKVH